MSSANFAKSKKKEDIDSSAKIKKDATNKNIKEREETRTNSFDPIWAGCFHANTTIKIHTLILGTHPSITSLKESQYFGHTMNAFWWIAGDCLGFRRSRAISPSTGEPYKLAQHLRYGQDKIIPYSEQVEQLAKHGFALWDVVASCERKGSLDQNIQKEMPNAIQEFCQKHSSIQRIVLVNGTTQSNLFNRHFKSWWESGDLKPGKNPQSIKAFGKLQKISKGNFENARIECICGPSVSPAAASLSYIEKRDFYETFCYKPGLAFHRSNMFAMKLDE